MRREDESRDKKIQMIGDADVWKVWKDDKKRGRTKIWEFKKHRNEMVCWKI